MPTKVLAFDLDDTLWEMRPILLRAEQELHSWLARHCPKCNYDASLIRRIREKLVISDPSLVTDLTQLRKNVIKQALLSSGYTVLQAAEYSDQAFLVFYEARNRVTFFDGVIDSLEKLSGNYILGSLTNGNADTVRLGLVDYFSFSFSAADVGSPKPAPDLFEAAIKHTGVTPEEMIYIGDHPLHDMDAAKTLGIKTIWINLDEQEFSGKFHPDQKITHLADLPDAVRRIDIGD